MKPETIRRILVVGVCFLAVMMLHLWPADAQSPSGQPREPMPTRSPQAEPTPSDTPTLSPPSDPDRSGPPADPPSTHRPWDPDERWNTRQPQPPQTSEPTEPPTTDRSTEPSPTPSDPPTRTPSIDPSEPPPSTSTPPTTPPTSEPPPTTPPTSEPPPSTDDPTPPTLPAPELSLTSTPDGYVLTWDEVPGTDTYFVYVKDGPDSEKLIQTPPDRTLLVEPGTTSIRVHAVISTESGPIIGNPAVIDIPDAPPPTDEEDGEGDSGDGDSGNGDFGDGDSGDRQPSGDPTPTP